MTNPTSPRTISGLASDGDWLGFRGNVVIADAEGSNDNTDAVDSARGKLGASEAA
jgi:hypothetical protein